VKYVFDAYTTKANKRLKVVLRHLWRVKIKTTCGFICISFEDFHIDKIALERRAAGPQRCVPPFPGNQIYIRFPFIPFIVEIH
jgi:hypothetical protein